MIEKSRVNPTLSLKSRLHRIRFYPCFIFSFVIILIACAFLLLLNERVIAENLALIAYFLLGAIVFWQIINCLFRDGKS